MLSGKQSLLSLGSSSVPSLMRRFRDVGNHQKKAHAHSVPPIMLVGLGAFGVSVVIFW